MKSISRSSIVLLLFIATILSSCGDKVNEPEFEARFIVENATSIELLVQAKDGPDFLILENPRVDAGTRTQVYSSSEVTQGSVLPSLIFTEFRVFAKVGLKDSTIYNRVRNNDWVSGTETEEYQELILTIDN